MRPCRCRLITFYDFKTMNKNLTKVALRYHALFLDIKREDIDMKSNTSVMTRAFAARLMENGFSLSEELLHALDMVSTDTLADTVECINNIMGVNLNWASLVKGWDKPTKLIQRNDTSVRLLHSRRNISVGEIQRLSVLWNSVRDEQFCV